MATSRIKTSSVLQGFPKSRSLLAGNAAYEPGSYYSIATVTVGSGGSSSITFSSIPQTYTHLQLRGIFRGTSTSVKDLDNNRFQINGESSNYSRHGLWGAGSGTVTGFGNTSNTYIYLYNNLPRSTVLANVFSSAIIDILDYTNTNKYKTVRFLHGTNANTDITSDVICFESAANFNNTNAVTSITFTPALGDYAQYSEVALYGIKA